MRKNVAEILDVVLNAPMCDFISQDQWVAVVSACASDPDPGSYFSFSWCPIKTARPSRRPGNGPDPDFVSFDELSAAVAIVQGETIGRKPTQRERFLANFIDVGVSRERARQCYNKFDRDPVRIARAIKDVSGMLEADPENHNLRMLIHKLIKHQDVLQKQEIARRAK